MAKVTIRRGDSEFEIHDLTFEQVKELVGVNGYSARAPKASPSSVSPVTPMPQLLPLRDDYDGFMASISDRGRLFIATLQQHPKGIDSNALAGKLGFKDARQIGGLTGAGITRMAKKHGVKVKEIYHAEITFPENKRTVTFYPGKFVLEMDKEKPAV